MGCAGAREVEAPPTPHHRQVAKDALDAALGARRARGEVGRGEDGQAEALEAGPVDGEPRAAPLGAGGRVEPPHREHLHDTRAQPPRGEWRSGGARRTERARRGGTAGHAVRLRRGVSWAGGEPHLRPVVLEAHVGGRAVEQLAVEAQLDGHAPVGAVGHAVDGRRVAHGVRGVEQRRRHVPRQAALRRALRERARLQRAHSAAAISVAHGARCTACAGRCASCAARVRAGPPSGAPSTEPLPKLHSMPVGPLAERARK